MAGTMWLSYPATRKHWLLDDGSVIFTPDLETTTSGRRVRIKGVQETSTPEAQADELVWTTVQKVAETKGRTILMCLGDETGTKALDHWVPTEAETRHLSTAAEPHFVKDDGPTTITWEFRHPKMPIQARIVVKHWFTKNYSYQPAKWHLNVSLYTPLVAPLLAAQPTIASVTSNDDDDWAVHMSQQFPYSIRQQVTDALLRTKPNWMDDIPLGTRTFDSQRAALNTLAKLLRTMDDVGSIDIPDFTDPEKPKWMTLKLYRTTAGSDLLQTISEMLEGQPIVEKLASKWGEMVDLFRQLGVVMPKVPETEFGQLLATGEATLEVDVAAEDEHGTDSRWHSLRVNLLTGTIVVACSAATTKNEIATEYDMALIKAQMTGKEDEFLRYARHYSERATTQRADAMSERREKLNNAD